MRIGHFVVAKVVVLTNPFFNMMAGNLVSSILIVKGVSKQ
jgi:hypothetical protein